jgi:predicted O-methyltransferase YrrM
MEIMLPAAHEYSVQFSEEQDALLKEIHAYTTAHHAESHMISGPVQGQFLTMISKMIRPKRILEIGTFTGYSALCLTKGLNDTGELHTIEMREADAKLAISFFEKSPDAQKIKMHIGDAHTILDQVNEDWDLVFVDADKTGYINYYEQLLPKLKPGSWLLFDNVLFHGEVLKDNITGKNAIAIHAFNEHVCKDDRVEKVLLTVRDGLMLMRKK